VNRKHAHIPAEQTPKQRFIERLTSRLQLLGHTVKNIERNVIRDLSRQPAEPKDLVRSGQSLRKD